MFDWSFPSNKPKLINCLTTANIPDTENLDPKQKQKKFVSTNVDEDEEETTAAATSANKSNDWEDALGKKYKANFIACLKMTFGTVLVLVLMKFHRPSNTPFFMSFLKGLNPWKLNF